MSLPRRRHASSPARPRLCALRRLASHSALVATLSAGACSGADDDAAARAPDDARVRRYQFDDAIDPAIANGLSVAEVVARGAGCPEGNWFTQIADDGKSFRVRLIGYEVAIEDSTQSAQSACTLSIRLRSRAPVAFAVKSIAYIGFAFLDDGVRARFSTRPYFPGGPHQGRGDALELLGPYDSEFVQQTEADALRWSDCGVEREVAVDTHLSIDNTTSRGVGFIGIGEAHAAVPGAVDTARFGITIAVRTCGDSVDAGIASPSVEADAGTITTNVPHGPVVAGLDASVPATEHDSSDTK